MKKVFSKDLKLSTVGDSSDRKKARSPFNFRSWHSKRQLVWGP